ncbi:hypothetical protein DL89DRAFT_264425 [Linderina pennispora]|uniref:Arrestin C-terminal-like domain-containing protein n=1 Tax=Linderina pennispora TaxID=61395 RepID=A0A1Y1WLY8_9FUNG|nr:uncharacterized protein DL89DRAFT_264425 [Linderina pennispora]ORX74590.1 hypothetical protein DL89DRAFT_264425 [Linderina pennispora]
MVKGNRIEFELDQPEIILRGMVDEASGTIFSGTLVVNLSESIRVKGLSMSLTGCEHLEWDYHSDDLLATFHRETDGRKVETWEAGRHEFPFSLVFPGTLPETISIPYANVTYTLKATLRRTGIMSNLSAKREVLVKRDLTMDGGFGTGAIDVENRWRDKLDFHIVADADTFVPGDEMMAKFTFQPLVKNIHLTKIGVLLKEYVRCHTPMGDAEKMVSRAVAFSEVYVAPTTPRSESAVPLSSGSEAVPPMTHSNTSPCMAGEIRPPMQAHTSTHSGPSSVFGSLISHYHSTHSSNNSSSVNLPSSSSSRLQQSPRFGGISLLPLDHGHPSLAKYDKSAGASGSRTPTCAPPGIDLTHAVEESIRLKVPEAFKRLQYDHISSYIEVTHKLKFSIHFKDPDNHPHTLWISVPVSIVPVIAGSTTHGALDERVAVGTADPNPPTYDELLSEVNSAASSIAPLSRPPTASLRSTDDSPVESVPPSDTEGAAEQQPVPSIDVVGAGSRSSSDSEPRIIVPPAYSCRRQSRNHLMVDGDRPQVHPVALQNFLRRSVVMFPASTEATPVHSPSGSPMASPLMKATADNMLPSLATYTMASPSGSLQDQSRLADDLSVLNIRMPERTHPHTK